MAVGLESPPASKDSEKPGGRVAAVAGAAVVTISDAAQTANNWQAIRSITVIPPRHRG